MKTCFSTLGCPEWSFTDIVSVASDLGYDGIEIRGISGELHAPALAPFSPSNIETTIQKLAALSLTIPCLTSACNLNNTSEMDEARAYVDTASALGAPYIRVLGDKAPASSDGVSLNIVVQNLVAIAEYAKQKGVMPLIETNGFFAKTKVLGALLGSIDTGNIGVLYDIHHPYRFFGESPSYALKNIGPYIKHVHIKDSTLTDKKVTYKIVGEGNVPCQRGRRGAHRLWIRRVLFSRMGQTVGSVAGRTGHRIRAVQGVHGRAVALIDMTRTGHRPSFFVCNEYSALLHPQPHR